MADRKHGHQPPPTESEVRSQDWYGEDLSGQEHVRVAFIEVDMTEAVNRGAVFTECTFKGVRFNASSHQDAAFVNCTFTRSHLFDASFTNCKMVGTMFDGTSFDLMKADGGDWSFVGLPGADLRKARFENLRMREADLTGARLEGAVLRRVDLSGAWLAKADLSRCDLRGSDLTSLDPLTVQLKGALIDHHQATVIAANLGLDVRAE
jgi:uncharacterized protein YjbI with pentapeptide repeats